MKLEVQMGSRRYMSKLMSTIRCVMLAALMVMVSQFQLGECQGFSPGNDTTGKVLDTNKTMEQLQELVYKIDTTQDYYPGLVAFQRWQDPLNNVTVLGRILLWTPNCSMQGRDEEYNLDGLLISNNILQILNNSRAFQEMIEQGSAWATWIEGNLWVDYFSTSPSDSSDQSLISNRASLAFQMEKPDRGNTSSLNGSGIGCIPYNNQLVIDSLISDTNGYINVLYPRQFVMSTNRKYFVEMQLDCNLVVYTFPDRKPLWASNTYKAGTNCTAIMQVDGNLVVYNGDGAPLWSSKSYILDYIGHFRFTMQKDGLAVIFNMESGQILWASYRYGMR